MRAPLELYSDVSKQVIPALEQEDDPSKYFSSLVKINLDTLETYYKMVKAHTENSFKIATWVGVAGFVLIVVGVALAYLGKANVTVGLLTGVSGVVAEIIAGIQFWLYSKTVQQISDYRDSLLHIQNMLISSKFVNMLDEEANKASVIAKIVDNLNTLTLHQVDNRPSEENPGT
ncbi:MAG TPA: hypothetical protein PLG20_03185 [Candidatus Syntrophosphaera sp.]|jgi:hypothetical protein|nr:hypothetical protein [Candidatus Syntrophosphaera sp.]